MKPSPSGGTAAGQLARRLFGTDRAGQRGAVLALVAVGAVALIGAVGLAVDGSRMLEERRHAQAAADHAATAAAHNRCTSSGATVDTARAAGQAAATANGFDDASPRVVVTIDPVGAAATTYDFRAVVTSNIDGTFSRVLGFSAFDVSAEATASGTGCGGGGASPGAIFGGGTCKPGELGLEVSGSNAQVYGGIHTNADASVSGSDNDFTEPPNPPDDPFTYDGTFTNGGGMTNEYQAPWPRDEGSKGWPSGWAPSAITGGGSAPPTPGSLLRQYYDLADANGTNDTNDTLFTTKVTDITKDGVYYTTHADGMDIGSITWPVGGNTRNVVLVAPNGPIKISVSHAGRIFNPYDHASLTKKGIVMLSNVTHSSSDTFIERCNKYAINVSGQGATWNGIMWAPGGLIEFSGSDNAAVNGSLVSWAVSLGGQNILIRQNPSLFTGSPTVILLK